MERQRKNKVCARCKKEKGVREFKDISYKSLSSYPGKIKKLHPWCTVCRMKVKKEYSNAQIEETDKSYENYIEKNNGWPTAKEKQVVPRVFVY